MIVSPRLDPGTQTDEEMLAILIEDCDYGELDGQFVVDVLRGRRSEYPDVD